MNLRTVTRGDAVVAAAALLLLISSFLPYVSADSNICAGCSANAWHTSSFPLLPSVFFLGVIGGALVLASRFLPQAPKPAGIELSQWGIVLTVASFWSALWALLGGGPGVSHSFGAYLAFLFALVLAGAAVATPMLPQLALPLLPDAPQQVPGAGGYPPYGQQQGQPHPYQQHAGLHFHHGQPVQQAQPGQPFTGPQGPQAPQQQGGYGYPQQGQQPQPGGPFGSPYGAPAPAPTPVAEPQPERAATPTPEDAQPREDHATALLTPIAKQPQPQPQPHDEPSAEPQPGASAAHPQSQPAAPAFAPFWFAVPAARPLADEHGGPGAPVGELVPGTWYLAIAQRGEALLTQTQEGKRGLLNDTSGIQRG